MVYYFKIPSDKKATDEKILGWLERNVKPTWIWITGFEDVGAIDTFGYFGWFQPYIIVDHRNEIAFKRGSDLMAFKLWWE